MARRFGVQGRDQSLQDNPFDRTRWLVLALIVLSLTNALSADQQSILDVREQKAYIAAVQQTDVRQRIKSLEAFLQAYPHTSKRENALILLMQSYFTIDRGLGLFAPQIMSTAEKLVRINPRQLQALVVLTVLHRSLAEAGNKSVHNMSEAARYGRKGLAALPVAREPEHMSPGTKDSDRAIFTAAIGIDALMNRNFDAAQKYLFSSVEDDRSDVRNVYQLAIAYLTAAPPDTDNGIFFLALASNLAGGSASQAFIVDYGRREYEKRHGSQAGWDDMVAATKLAKLPPLHTMKNSIERRTSQR
jgi:hypothetical protein